MAPPSPPTQNAAFDLLGALAALAIAIVSRAAFATANCGAAAAHYAARTIRQQLAGHPINPNLAAPAPPPAQPVPAPAAGNHPIDPNGWQHLHHPPNHGRFYAVFVGTHVGVFVGWHAASHHVVGVSGAVHYRYGSLADAQAAFQEALLAGRVRIVTVAGAPAGIVPPPVGNGNGNGGAGAGGAGAGAGVAA